MGFKRLRQTLIYFKTSDNSLYFLVENLLLLSLENKVFNKYKFWFNGETFNNIYVEK